MFPDIRNHLRMLEISYIEGLRYIGVIVLLTITCEFPLILRKAVVIDC